MGKLLDKLMQVGKSTSAGMGFLMRSKPTIKALCLLVTLAKPDAELALAAVEGGADALLLPWIAGKASFASTLESYNPVLQAVDIPCGLDFGVGLQDLQIQDLETLTESKVDFIALSQAAPARLLGLKGIDKMVTLTETIDPLFIRGVNLLPVEVVRFSFIDDLKQLQAVTITDMIRYRFLRESLRFPVVLPVEQQPKAEEVRTLVTMGVQALLFTAGTSITSKALRQAVSALRQELDKNPPSEDKEREGGFPSLGGMMAVAKEEPAQEPSPEPDEE